VRQLRQQATLAKGAGPNGQASPIDTAGNLQDFNLVQNAEPVPPTLVLKKTQEHSIRRNKVQDRLSRHAFYT
jgi:hypothetical protein